MRRSPTVYRGRGSGGFNRATPESHRSWPSSTISDEADAVIPADRACRFRDGVDASAGVERTRDVNPVVLGERLEDL